MSDDIISLAINKLVLDSQNPRLPKYVDRNEKEIIRYIAKTTALDELMSAIAENDFFQGEPLIAYKKDDSDSYIVIEGNRRLTAVMLLNDLALLDNPSQRMQEIVHDAKHIPTIIPVVVKPNRESVLPYLGFRHITGVKQWDPLSKARYMEMMFNLSNTANQQSDRYKEVARAIGSRSDHIKRNLDALAVYRAMENKDFFGIKGLNEGTVKFSVLSTALANKPIGAFVGIRTENENSYAECHPISNPDCINIENLQYLSNWLYAKDPESGATIVGESRNLSHLSTVLERQDTTNMLIAGSSLDYAYQHTEGVAIDFNKTLYDINAKCMVALGMTGNIDWNEDSFEVIREINETVRQIATALKSKKDSKDDLFD